MKNIIVTGGAGFLGSNLCERLVNEGNFVLCIDNLYTGREENVAHLLGKENFVLRNYDVRNGFDDVENIKQNLPFDQIYNLACPASPPHYQKDPVYTLTTNVQGTHEMLKLAKEFGARFLQASTSEVYGDPQVHPQTEEYRGCVNPIGIRACYDEGKRAAEALTFDYERLYGTDVRVMRIFNTYGPNMDPQDGRVVSNFIMQALKNEQITIYGTGNQTRSFCYVDDLIDGMVKLMNTENVIGPYNIGNPGEFTINELAKEVLKQTKSKSGIDYHELPADDPTQRCPDITKAKQDLGWEPAVSLKEGLAKTIPYFKGQL